MTNYEKSPDIVGAVQAIQPFLGYVRGESTIKRLDIDLPENYKQAVRIYGGYCQQAYEIPEIASLLASHYTVENGQINITGVPMSESYENIYLGRDTNKDSKPQLLLVVRTYREPHVTMGSFLTQVLEEYGNDPIWEFRDLDELYSDRSGYNYYYAASRKFIVDDLWRNYRLFHHFVNNTKWMFERMRETIISRQINVPNKGNVDTIIGSVIQANTILETAFKKK